MQTRVFVTLMFGIALGVFILMLTLSGMIRVVLTDSMAPTIRAGDVIILKSPTTRIAPGMIVTYSWNDKIITHRVMKVEGDTIITKGDNSDQADPWIIPVSNVIGVAYFSIPYLGYVLTFIRKPIGLLLVILVPSVIIIGFELKEIAKMLHPSSDVRT